MSCFFDLLRASTTGLRLCQLVSLLALWHEHLCATGADVCLLLPPQVSGECLCHRLGKGAHPSSKFFLRLVLGFGGKSPCASAECVYVLVAAGLGVELLRCACLLERLSPGYIFVDMTTTCCKLRKVLTTLLDIYTDCSFSWAAILRSPL